MKILNKVKNELPGLIDYIMFYNTGIVFQSSFSEKANVPVICANLNEVINTFRQSLVCYGVSSTDYQKIIFESTTHIIIILKLGEDSNIALFFDNTQVDEVNIRPIQKYLNKLEDLIDMDKSELEYN
ncbi:MAG: hypothetical protein JW776_06060 [Candidatus Lokiarchaeota archaeon]|nr:hypothetical protein [Candidatus Lokiarchaeota archaeon]